MQVVRDISNINFTRLKFLYALENSEMGSNMCVQHKFNYVGG